MVRAILSTAFPIFVIFLVDMVCPKLEVYGAEQKRKNVSIGNNFRLYPSSVTQSETFITRHPHNPSILFASANTINFNNGFFSEGVYVTTDGGATWFGSDTCSGAPITFHSGDPGIAIDKDGRFLLIRLSPLPGLYSHYSTDNGRTWSGQRTVTTNDQDRATLTSDGNPLSGFYGRSYAVWVRFAPPYPVFFAHTDNAGASWVGPVQVNNPLQRCQGGEIAMAPNGVVNICWAAVIGTSPFTEDYVGFASSSDGGATWRVLESAFDMNGIAGAFPQKGNIRVNGLPRIDVDRSGGPRNGWTYIVTTQRNLVPAGSDPDIIMNRSTDGGFTWSGGIRINQDQFNNGKYQFFPAIHVDDGGGINVLFYDDRNTTTDSAGVYLARSTDGGVIWNEYPVSDHNFRPQPIGGLGQGYQGDNIGLTSAGDTLWPVWMDNSTGIYQIWTAPIRISTIGTAVEEGSPPARFRLHQNYPNPFNPTTTVRYEVSELSDVTLNVFDVLGREVALLVSEEKEPGEYRASWDAAGVSSGVYLYRLRAGGNTITKKMLLMK